MKNILIIDGAVNCVYDVFSASDADYFLIFKDFKDIAFIDEIHESGDELKLNAAFNRIRKRRIKKSEICGIHGTIFYELDKKKVFYPTRIDEDAVNPDGSLL